MVDFEQFIKNIKSQDYYDDQIVYIQHIPANDAEFGTLDDPLKSRLQRWLDQNKVGLWAHQARAINSIRKGKNTAISTSTASGKSMCYNLSVLDSILNNPKTTALYLFPTKALSRDQHLMLSTLMKETNIKRSRLGIYDGDIEREEKRQVLANANIIITNPYGLHYYLPWFKKKWRRICENLKYIVLDEIHIYRGVFGSNFGFLIRRLKRILDLYGVKPIWILSSATIYNAKQFAEKLVGEQFTLVDEDSSPSGAKKVILWDLPFDETSNKYRSAHQETKSLFISHLKQDIQTLTFTLSRKMAELQAIWTREALPGIKHQIRSYRAGISKKTRRLIEQNFKRRNLLGISSTNALELGIDIGSLQATICSGFPGTLSSLWQQIGRSGRGEELSLATFIPMANPLDLFYVHNPDVLFGPIREDILITLKNKYIIKNHLCCAAKESALSPKEYINFGVQKKELFESCIDELVEEGLLMKRGELYYWKGDYYPNSNYGLNDLSDRMYQVILQTPTNEYLLTTEDESYVFRDLHPGAVYLYETETYTVQDLDLQERKVYIKKENVDYYTQSLKHTDVTILNVEFESTTGPHKNI
ncbi:MAG: DEAD/DEAH box helicase, partial [Promethearchaeota archaeon]